MREPDGNDPRDPRDGDYLWDRSGAIDPEVERLERLLAPHGLRDEARPTPPAKPKLPPRARRRPLVAFGVTVTMIAAAAALALLWWWPRTPTGREPAPPVAGGPSWRVEALAGAVRCGDAHDCDALHVGQWLTTGDGGRARLEVADIGTMEVEPGTRLRLAATGADQHRLELQRGEISASVIAPPRLLVVDTPSARAVDLGCAYTLAVDEHGAGRLEVSSGWVALEAPGREVLVPAGAEAEMRPQHGPGAPRWSDAPAAFVEAVAALERSLDGAAAAGTDAALAAALAAVLDAASPRDTLTLFHLLPLVPNGQARLALLDRIERLGPPVPDGVSRAAVLALEPAALAAWRAELEMTWL